MNPYQKIKFLILILLQGYVITSVSAQDKTLFVSETSVIEPVPNIPLKADTLNLQAISDTLTQKVKEIITASYPIVLPKPTPNVYMNFILDAFLNVLGTVNHNAPAQTEPNNIVFYYSFTFENRLFIKKKVILNTYYFYEFGNRYFFEDSIPSAIINDRWDLNNKLLIPFGNKNLSFSLSVNMTSQYCKQYDYRTNDSGEQERYIYTCSGSPKYTIYSGGLNYDFWKRSSINVSLASAKKTSLKTQKLFNERQTDFLYGIEKGKNKLFTYGVNVTLQISRQKIFKNFYFENSTDFFVEGKKYQAFKYTTIDLKNTFHYLFFSHFRFSFKTDLKYNIEVFGTKPFITNQLMLGVYFNNKI